MQHVHGFSFDAGLRPAAQNKTQDKGRNYQSSNNINRFIYFPFSRGCLFYFSLFWPSGAGIFTVNIPAREHFDFGHPLGTVGNGPFMIKLESQKDALRIDQVKKTGLV